MPWTRRAYYARPDEDLAQRAIAVSSADADPAFPATNLLIEDASKQAKLLTTSGGWVFQFDEAIAPAAVALIYHYLDPGLEVRIQGHTSDTWTSPSYDEVLTIPSKRRDGPSYQRWTRNVLHRLELDDEEAYAFWRLQVVGTNSQVVALSRVLFPSALHPIDLFLESEMPESDGPGDIVHTTALGVDHVIVMEGPRRQITPTLIATDLSAGTAPIQEAEDFRELHESAEGRAHPFLFVHPSGEPWLVRPEGSRRERSHHKGGYQIWQGVLMEVSRAVPWP